VVGEVSTIAQLLIRPRLSDLQQALDAPARAVLDAAIVAAREQDTTLWLVGGAVRDLALGASINDLDVAIAGDADRFARVCGAALPDAEVHMRLRERFGTASVLAGGVRVDIARLRTETYAHPGALPRVRATRSIERDLARRDFTVNAMALALTGERQDELVDPFGGLVDLESRTLRVLHPQSFEDDATRIWRGARTAVLTDLRPDEETGQLIRDGVHWLDTISGPRLWSELQFTAKRGRAGRVLALLDAWGALEAIHPSLTVHPDAERALRHRSGPIPPLRLAALLIAPLGDPRGILERLAVDRETRETVLETRRLLDAQDTMEALASLEGTRTEARTAAKWLQPERQAERQQALRRWERTRSPLTAADLERMDVPRGPLLGHMLARLRRDRFLGTLSTPAEARAAVREALTEIRGV
jgi:tRNA nucleotidyltransferase (CCA-adding enzyme)